MAIDDIYGNKAAYEKFVENIEDVLVKPEEQSKCRGKRKYYCKNKANIKYFQQLIRRFEVDDLSYIRRLRLLQVMKILTHHVECDLKSINGLESDKIVIEIRKASAPSQLNKMEKDIRRIGKVLFQESKMPKFFKEIKIKTDKSRQTARKDKLTFDEFDRIMKYFSKDVLMQAYLSLSFESLARPQEVSFLKIGDVELFDSYAKINVSEHGKEGVKKLLTIDSYPYLLKLLNSHSDRDNKRAYLFQNIHAQQITPFAVNKKLRIACRKLSINKPITAYSLKRFGVTFRRLAGDSDAEIQKIAGWTTTKQIRTYDQSDQEDVFKRQLIKKGLLKDDKVMVETPKTKLCQFCGELIGFADMLCPKCQHVVDRNMVQERIKKDKELMEFIDGIKELKQTQPELFEALRNIGRNKGLLH